MNSSLSLSDVAFGYSGQKLIFESFNYRQEIAHKAIWMGPSGRGKSSLAKVIAGLLPVRSGRILFEERDIIGAGLDRFYVGPENDLFQWQNLEKHFKFLLQNVKYERALAENKINKSAELLEIDGLMKKYPNQLSTGEMRRFQILRTLVLNPKLVIYDETFSALDTKLKSRIMPKLMSFWTEQKTSVIIISHESDKNFDFKFDQILDFSL